MTARHAVAILLALGTLAACAVTTIKFPAEEFLLEYVALRDQFRDDTYTARKRCAGDRAKLTVEKQGKCAEFDVAVEKWHRRDQAVLKATLAGGTIDKATLDATMGYIGPLLKLAADIAL